MKHRHTLLCATVVLGGFVGTAATASATTLFTAVQTDTADFGGAANNYSMSGSTVLTFNGFDSSLGTLVGVYLSLSLNGTLNNVASVTSAPLVSESVGNPIALTASATTNVFAPLGLSVSTSFSTPSYVGTVTPGSLNVVGTDTVTNQTAQNSISNPPYDLSSYIGGTGAVSVTVLESGTQGGSVPGNVLTGNQGNADITLSVDYAYTNPTANAPEPATASLVGLGMVAIGALHRRRQAK